MYDIFLAEFGRSIVLSVLPYYDEYLFGMHVSLLHPLQEDGFAEEENQRRVDSDMWEILETIGSLTGNSSMPLFELPPEVKTILIIALVLAIGTTLLTKAVHFLKYVVIAAIIYFGLVYLGIL